MSIYRGAGGSGDAVNDASSEAVLVQQLANEAQDSADAAAASSTAASSSASAAASSASSASTSASNAATSATNAANSASSASTSATNAANSATAAQTAETAAELAETNAETAETNAANSASAASTSASNAATSATNASNSASAAATSATNASNSASAASTSASNASTSATAAAGSASSASTSASNASTAATNASNSASSASTSASTATTQAGIATTKAGEAATSATNAATSATNASNSASAASTSATNASNSASAAATSETNAAASFDSFDDRYLGAKSSAPSVDNDGNTLLVGALYFNSVDSAMKVWNGTAWLDAYASLSGALIATNNLADLTNTTTARSNLGVAIGTNVQAWDADLDTWATKTAPSGTVVGTSDTQTLTNKTLTSPVVTGGSINNTPIGATTANTGAFTTLGATGVATFSAGTVSAPAITTTGDTNTGIFFPAADTIAFTEGGVESMRIDSAGNVGVGTSSPSQKLTVFDGTNTTTYQMAIGASAGGSYNIGRNFTNGLLTFYGTQTSFTGYVFTGIDGERMRIDSSGNVGIGTSSTTSFGSYKFLTIQGANTSNGGALELRNSDNTLNAQFYVGGAEAVIGSTTNHPFVLRTNGTERMRIDSSGNVIFKGAYTSFGDNGYIRNDSSGWLQLQAGSNGTRFMDAGNSGERMRIDSSGNLCVGTTSPITVAGVPGTTSFATTTAGAWATVVRNSASTLPWGLAVNYNGVSPNNTSQNFVYCYDTAAERFSVRSNGGIANYSGNNVNLSDAREKINVELAGSYLDKICSIPVKTFNYIDQNIEEDDGLTLGVIAQEVQAVAPEFVSESNWGTQEEPKMRLSIYQTDLQYALMKSIQELKTIVDAQAVRIAELESK